MKFLRPRPFSGQTLQQAVQFLRIDLAKIFSDMVEGFKHLRLEENFDSFVTSVRLEGAGNADNLDEIAVPNQLRTRALKWFATNVTGDNRIVEYDRTETHIFLKNLASAQVTATIVFMR